MSTNEAELDCIEIDNSVVDLLSEAADSGCFNKIEIAEYKEGD